MPASVDEAEDAAGLKQVKQAVEQHDAAQRGRVTGDDALVDDQFAQICCGGIQHRHSADEEEETNHQAPVRPGLSQHPQHSPAVELGGEFFFLEFESFVSHKFFSLAAIRMVQSAATGSPICPSSWASSSSMRACRS